MFLFCFVTLNVIISTSYAEIIHVTSYTRSPCILGDFCGCLKNWNLCNLLALCYSDCKLLTLKWVAKCLHNSKTSPVDFNLAFKNYWPTKQRKFAVVLCEPGNLGSFSFCGQTVHDFNLQALLTRTALKLNCVFFFFFFPGIWGRWKTFSVNSGRQCLYHWRTKVRRKPHTHTHTTFTPQDCWRYLSKIRSRWRRSLQLRCWTLLCSWLVPRWQQSAEPDSLPTGPTKKEAVLRALLPGQQLRAPPSWVGGGNKDTITHCPSPLVSPANRLLPFSNKLSLSVLFFFLKGFPFSNFIL